MWLLPGSRPSNCSLPAPMVSLRPSSRTAFDALIAASSNGRYLRGNPSAACDVTELKCTRTRHISKKIDVEASDYEVDGMAMSPDRLATHPRGLDTQEASGINCPVTHPPFTKCGYIYKSILSVQQQPLIHAVVYVGAASIRSRYIRDSVMCERKRVPQTGNRFWFIS